MSTTLEDSRTLADGVNALNQRRTSRAESAAGFIVALVIGVLLGLLMWHYATPCEGMSLCMGMLAQFQRPAYSAQQHPDERLSESISAAFQAGVEHGESLHYRQGWRAGIVNGLILGTLLGAVIVGGALKLGLNVGAL